MAELQRAAADPQSISRISPKADIVETPPSPIADVMLGDSRFDQDTHRLIRRWRSVCNDGLRSILEMHCGSAGRTLQLGQISVRGCPGKIDS